ncbi:hypothetical protein CB0940_00345 [Cercospora beticola]|nr:hypothetical protein CB0940_00345 [Cercospora beticola]PIB01575.1 hypothetical protein CB0940_00345 [Cercospora beticola]
MGTAATAISAPQELARLQQHAQRPNSHVELHAAMKAKSVVPTASAEPHVAFYSKTAVMVVVDEAGKEAAERMTIARDCFNPFAAQGGQGICNF